MNRLILASLVLVLVAQSTQGRDETPPNLIAGKKVEADAVIRKGDRLVGIWEKKNYLIEVLEVRSDNRLKVLWGGELHERIRATDLYYIGDATPTRKKRASPLPESYRAMDKNGDGQIGLYEWDRTKYALFKQLDKNHDGFLTPQELADKSSPVAAPTTPPVTVAASAKPAETSTETKPAGTETADNQPPTTEPQENDPQNFQLPENAPVEFQSP